MFAAILAALFLHAQQPLDTLPVIKSDRPLMPVAEGGDPYFSQQWGLYRIRAEAAWALAAEINPEAQFPIIAIIDTHLIPAPPYASDFNIAGLWHVGTGTPVHNTNPACHHAVHVASIAASVTGNGIGMAGVATGAPIYGVQVLSGCFGTQTSCALGINKAVEVGARVANMSLQYGATPEPVMQTACANAAAAGMLLVAASGNYSWNNAIAVPAMLNEVLGVGAINSHGERAYWSNAGDDLELVAPGVNVLGLGPSSYVEWDGTSMAAPHVTGAAALIMAVYPTKTAREVRTLLTSTATDLGPPGRDPEYGWGCLNVYRALKAADPCPPDINRDGFLTAADFAAFQQAFAAGMYRGDCNGDEAWTIADFACFQGKFVAGCSN